MGIKEICVHRFIGSRFRVKSITIRNQWIVENQFPSFEETELNL